MTWRRLGLALAGVVWVSGCGDSSSDGPGGTIVPGPGGFAAAAGQAGAGGKAGQGGQGAAGSGAAAGVAGNGAAAGSSPNTCSVPVAAGQGCPTEGATCGDACGNACKCNDGQWFCNGPCTVPPVCSPGAECQPGFACGGGDENGCVVNCACGGKGVLLCATDCSNVCPIESAVCGGACGQVGQQCACFGKDGGVPCTCLPGPNDGPVWDCNTTPTGCQAGAACKLGEQCGTASGPSGCSTSCLCGQAGTFVCTTACASTCPDEPALCGDTCVGSPDPVCKCFSKGGDVVPCGCEKSSWVCDTPVDPCTPGAFCAPGTTCEAKQSGGCVLSCGCSPGGLYQCKSDCPPDPGGCPDTAPKPGSMCSSPGLSCSFGAFETCACNKQGAWDCAF